MPLVSVIIPTLNRPHYLSRTVKSVLNQSHQELEILIVDDGSTDDTASVVHTFADPRIHYTYQENRGLSAARNTGIRSAAGDFLGFLDDDDLWLPEMIECALQAFDRSNAGLVYTGSRFIDQHDQVLPEAPRRPQKRGVLLVENLLDTVFFPNTVLVRRGCAEAVGGFDESLSSAEDWDFFIRIAAEGYVSDFVELPLALYRMHGPSMSTNLERMEMNSRRVLEKAFAALRESEYAHYKAESFGRLEFRHSVKRFEVGAVDKACERFVQAVTWYPNLLLELGTYYQVICAMQPNGYKGTGKRLDLELGESHMARALDAVFSAANEPRILSLRSIAWGCAYLTLARLYYAGRDMSRARHYLGQAIQRDPSAATRANLLATYGKTFLPPAILDRVKARRGRAQGPSLQ